MQKNVIFLKVSWKSTTMMIHQLLVHSRNQRCIELRTKAIVYCSWFILIQPITLKIPNKQNYLYSIFNVTWFQRLIPNQNYILSRELTYPTWEKENHLQKCLGRGHVSSQEGNQLLRYVYILKTSPTFSWNIPDPPWGPSNDQK